MRWWRHRIRMHTHFSSRRRRLPTSWAPRRFPANPTDTRPPLQKAQTRSKVTMPLMYPAVWSIKYRSHVLPASPSQLWWRVSLQRWQCRWRQHRVPPVLQCRIPWLRFLPQTCARSLQFDSTLAPVRKEASLDWIEPNAAENRAKDLFIYLFKTLN